MAHTVLSTIRDFLSNGITTKKHALDEGWYFGEEVQDETDEFLIKAIVTVSVKLFEGEEMIAGILAYIEDCMGRAEYAELPKTSQVNVHLSKAALHVNDETKSLAVIQELLRRHPSADIQAHLDTMLLYKG